MDKSAYMKWGVNILIPILIFLVPVNDIFTMQMKLFLVITVASILLYAFEQINSMFVSLLMPFAWFMSGVAPLSVGFSGWVSDCTETTYLRNAGKGGMRWETARKPAISTGKRHFSGGKGFAIINNLENEGIGFEQGPFLMPWSGQKSPKTQRRTHGR